MVLRHSLLWKERPFKPTRNEARWSSSQNDNEQADELRLKRQSNAKSSRRRTQRRRGPESTCNDFVAQKSPLSCGFPWEILGKKRFTHDAMPFGRKPQCKCFLFSRWGLVFRCTHWEAQAGESPDRSVPKSWSHIDNCPQSYRLRKLPSKECNRPCK